MLNEKELILKRVNDYAETVNSAKTDLIIDFYTTDALFTPDHNKTILAVNLKSDHGKSFFKKNDFKIKYSDENVVIFGDFAFVTALAETSSKDKQTGETVLKESKDFFVFKKVDEKWKIFRYLFNNVNIIPS